MFLRIRTRWKKFWASLALLSFNVVVILVAFFAALIIFVWIAKYIFLDNKTAFDDAAFKVLSGWVSNVHTEVMQVFTFLGQVQCLATAHLLLTAWFLFIRKH